MKTSKMRLPLEFDFQTRRVTSKTNLAFMHECGYIVRNNCSFQFKDWRLVPNEVRLPLRHKLTVGFILNSNRTFKENGGSKYLTKIKASPPDNISKEDWEYL
ncbi:hypothetical protein R6Q59_006598 [Mikania micrantha]